MAISLNDHESRINSINTNISSLGTRITNLEKNPPKSYAIVKLTQVYFSSSYKLFEIPAAYRGSEWKWYVIQGNVKTRGSRLEFSWDGYGLRTYVMSDAPRGWDYTLKYERYNTSQIKGYAFGSLNGEMDCTVLFYK